MYTWDLAIPCILIGRVIYPRHFHTNNNNQHRASQTFFVRSKEPCTEYYALVYTGYPYRVVFASVGDTTGVYWRVEWEVSVDPLSLYTYRLWLLYPIKLWSYGNNHCWLIYVWQCQSRATRQIPALVRVSPINQGFVHACINSVQTHCIVRVEKEW